MLRDAQRRGIRRLYFCARDCYHLFHIAQIFAPHFPGIEARYLYISRDVFLYDPPTLVTKYLKQEGLLTTSESTAVVDLNSGGSTFKRLNQLALDSKCNAIFGYYWEIYCNANYSTGMPPHSCEINYAYLRYKTPVSKIVYDCNLFETFFSLTLQRRTIHYKQEADKIVPLFASKWNDIAKLENNEPESYHNYQELLSSRHESLIKRYTEAFSALHFTDRDVDTIWQAVVVPTLGHFFNQPHIHYLTTLRYFNSYSGATQTIVPYIRRHSLPYLLLFSARHKPDYIWKEGTFALSLPRLSPRRRQRIMQFCIATSTRVVQWVDMLVRFKQRMKRK